MLIGSTAVSSIGHDAVFEADVRLLRDPDLAGWEADSERDKDASNDMDGLDTDAETENDWLGENVCEGDWLSCSDGDSGDSDKEADADADGDAAEFEKTSDGDLDDEGVSDRVLLDCLVFECEA